MASWSRIVGIAGIVALAVALLLMSIQFHDAAVARGLGAAGGALLVAYAVIHRREVAAMLRRRSARRGANAALMTVFFTAILVMVQAISVSHRQVFDVTRNARHTLAPQTLEVLERLDADVELRAFFRATSPARVGAEGLIERYQRQTDRLRVEFIDPDRNPGVADEVGARYGDIMVSAGERRRTVRRVTEEDLTNAILQVTLDRFKALYFATGHGEKDTEDTERSGYAALRSGLEGQGYVVRPLSLVDVERVPDDCEVLVVAGPMRGYLDGELRRIDDYLSRGGSAMFMLDPRRELPGIFRLLARFHIELDPAILLDELVVVSETQEFDATVAKIRRYQPHEITKGLNVITMYPRARPVRIVPDTTLAIEAGYLALTEASSWGETDLDGFGSGRSTRDPGDLAPPLAVAAALTRATAPGAQTETPECRIVVVGDSDFVNNAFYGVLGNADFFLNCVGFLARDENLISIRPRRGLGDRVFISASQSRLIFAISIILMPLSVIVVGANVLTRRRRCTR